MRIVLPVATLISLQVASFEGKVGVMFIRIRRSRICLNIIRITRTLPCIYIVIEIRKSAFGVRVACVGTISFGCIQALASSLKRRCEMARGTFVFRLPFTW